ncbi:MAG: fumarylacetoacetate hydrolase family protein [Gammaproteobacteria bacterium]
MPYVSFQTRELQPRQLVGKYVGDDIAPLVTDTAGRSLKALLNRGGNLSRFDAVTDERFSPDGIDFLPPIIAPGKIFCIGLNYHAHRIETGNIERDYPTVFSRFATCLVGHDQSVWRPRVSEKMDFEGELAVVIGRDAHHVKEADAMDFVAGYSCFNDISIRDWQRHTSQFTPGKNFMRTGAFGPALVTKEELPDPFALTLSTRLNGKQMQHTTTDLMIFPIHELIAYISTFTRLEAGDVIVTGTPGGVGVKRQPQVFMQPGDTVEIDISGVGVLKNVVVDEPG